TPLLERFHAIALRVPCDVKRRRIHWSATQNSAFPMNKTKPAEALHDLWQLGDMPPAALDCVRLRGEDPVLPSSFAVGAAAQATIAAAALAACEFGHQRGAERQQLGVDMQHAALECLGWFSIDGRVPELW